MLLLVFASICFFLFQAQFLSSIESLRKEKKVIMEHLSDTEKQSQDLIVGIATTEKVNNHDILFPIL